MDKKYDIVYCKPCNAVKITEDDFKCLICGGTSEIIGFTHPVLQQMLRIENEG
jgi:predicted RNA-binding protein with PUA domain